jgi:hypothetical protein
MRASELRQLYERRFDNLQTLIKELCSCFFRLLITAIGKLPAKQVVYALVSAMIPYLTEECPSQRLAAVSDRQAQQGLGS